MANENKTLPVPAPMALALMQGKTLKYGEFRGGQASEFVGGKQKRLFKVFKASIETEKNGTFSVTEFLPDEVQTASYVAPFKKGDMVFCVADSGESVSGVQIITGKLHLASV